MLSQLIVCEIPKVHLEVLWGSPTWVVLLGDKWGSFSPLEGAGWAQNGSPVTAGCHIGPHVSGRRWGSPNPNGFFMQY